MHVGPRYHDAQVGRFITRDTVLSEEPYLYCRHDPVNAVDPDGHRPARRFWYWVGVIGVIGAEIVGGVVAIVTLPVTAPAWAAGAIVGAGVLAVGGRAAWAYGGDKAGPWDDGAPLPPPGPSQGGGGGGRNPFLPDPRHAY
jgi:hypothetical protein